MPKNNPVERKNDNAPMDAYLGGSRTFEIVFIALVLLSVIGVGITDFTRQYSPWYWYAMVPVFAIGCLIIEWTRARHSEMSILRILRTQFFIWVGLLAAVSVVYILLFTGRLNYENTGLVMLLLVSMTTYFAGVVLDYRLCLLGIALASTLLVMAFLEQYMWVVLIVGLIAAAIVFQFSVRKARRSSSSKVDRIFSPGCDPSSGHCEA